MPAELCGSACDDPCMNPPLPTPVSSLHAQPKNAFAETFSVSLSKAGGNIVHLANSPRSAAWAVDGSYFKHPEGFFEIGNWTSSFFTGMALLAYSATKDAKLALFARPDDSVYHAFRFPPSTGEPVAPDNYCGRNLDSHWARGTAWAIYGFALTYRHTPDAKYLTASVRLARRFVNLLDAE